MTLQELERRLEAHVPGSLIPRDTILGWIQSLEESGAPSDADALLTVEEVASELDRATSTVRGWLREELIDGAFKFRGREWRIPRRALRAFLHSEASHDPPDRDQLPDPNTADLGSWRKHRKEAS